MLKIWKNYYLDASSVYYTLKKYRVRVSKQKGKIQRFIKGFIGQKGGAGRSCKTHDP